MKNVSLFLVGSGVTAGFCYGWDRYIKHHDAAFCAILSEIWSEK